MKRLPCSQRRVQRDCTTSLNASLYDNINSFTTLSLYKPWLLICHVYFKKIQQTLNVKRYLDNCKRWDNIGECTRGHWIWRSMDRSYFSPFCTQGYHHFGCHHSWKYCLKKGRFHKGNHGINALGTSRGGDAIPRCVPRHLGML